MELIEAKFIMGEIRHHLYAEGRRPETSYAMGQIDNGIASIRRALEEKP